MINNSIQRATYKLNQHRQMGQSSNLSIFEVAKLLDTVRNSEKMAADNKSNTNSNLFFSFCYN